MHYLVKFEVPVQKIEVVEALDEFEAEDTICEKYGWEDINIIEIEEAISE